MNKKNVLIYPCNSDVAVEIYESLRYSLHLNVIGASAIRSAVNFIIDKEILYLPKIANENFISILNNFINQNKIDMIFLTHDDVIYYFSKNIDLIDAIVIGGDVMTNEIARHKSKTYHLFRNQDFCPKVFNDYSEVTQFPVFVKPDKGQASIGAKLITCFENLSLDLWDDHVVTEYLPGTEYTVDCFSNHKNELLYAFPRIRAEVKGGASYYNYEPDKEVINKIEAISHKINSFLHFKGLWFFQLKEDINGHLKLLEVCTRAATTMSFARFKGVNLPLLTIFAYLDYDVHINIINDKIELYRYTSTKVNYNFSYDKVYIDYDDTIIINNKINLGAITFIYQCANNNIDVFLITKHQFDLDNSLKHFNIPKSLFKEIIWIQMEEPKYLHITKTGAIFIDNHFKERFEVHEYCKIPVFDVEGIKSLIID